MPPLLNLYASANGSPALLQIRLAYTLKKLPQIQGRTAFVMCEVRASFHMLGSNVLQIPLHEEHQLRYAKFSPCCILQLHLVTTDKQL